MIRSGGFAAVVPMLVVALCAAAASGNTFTNPIVPRGGDPWAFQFGGQYFYTSTTGGDVKVARSPWLQSLNSNSRQVWNPPTNTPYGHNIWAPEIHRLNDKWYLYVAADDGADANHRMYVLEGDSQDPQGSYTFKGQISLPANRWAIDGTIFEHGEKDYFIWSGRTSGTTVDIGSSQSLYISEMSNPWTLTGNRTRISSPQYTWERHGHSVNEGPQILKNGNDVFLTYSASGFYTPQYAIGALKLNGTNPLLSSAWTKHNQPLFDGASGSGVEGTGHASFVKSPDGTQDWIVYHARTTNDAPRDVRIQPFAFGGANGLPQFGEPIPTGQSTPAPSGVPLVTFIPNLSFERGGTGWLDDFDAFGDAGAIDNDGEQFATITGGDGPRVGYLGTGIEGGVYQDVGLADAGLYTLSVGLAISDDQLALAASNPASFLLRLESVGLHLGGSANEADRMILGELEIASDSLDASAFKYFDLAALLAEGERVGTWLRVGLFAPDELATGGTPWDVKLDYITLDFDSTGGLAVPEPSSAAIVLASAAWLIGRRSGARWCAKRPIRLQIGA